MTELGIIIDFILVPWNALLPIFSNPSLRVTWDRLEQFENAESSISFTELGITIDFILVPSNALNPIFSNPSLRVTWDRLEQYLNA